MSQDSLALLSFFHISLWIISIIWALNKVITLCRDVYFTRELILSFNSFSYFMWGEAETRRSNILIAAQLLSHRKELPLFYNDFFFALSLPPPFSFLSFLFLQYWRKHRALHMSGTFSTTELRVRPWCIILTCHKPICQHQHGTL